MSNARKLAKLGGGPVFSAYHSSAQTLTGGVATKINFATEEFDTSNCYDNSTSRFTPNVAGYYKINAALQASGSNSPYVSVYKNGAQYKVGNVTGALGTGTLATISCLVYLNGSTDYVEIYGNFSATQATVAASTSSYFQGCLAAGA